jgi:hypothetical protein
MSARPAAVRTADPGKKDAKGKIKSRLGRVFGSGKRDTKNGPTLATQVSSDPSQLLATVGPKPKDDDPEPCYPKDSGQPEPSGVPHDPYGDYKSTLERYQKAVKVLHETLREKSSSEWGSFELPELDNLNDLDGLRKIRERIHLATENRKESIKNPSMLSKLNVIMERTFTAMSPFAKNLLAIAKEGQSVHSPLTRPLILDSGVESLRLDLRWIIAPYNGMSVVKCPCNP